jgi:hypothetical protein
MLREKRRHRVLEPPQSLYSKQGSLAGLVYVFTLLLAAASSGAAQAKPGAARALQMHPRVLVYTDLRKRSPKPGFLAS